MHIIISFWKIDDFHLLLIPAHFMVSKHLKEKRWNTKMLPISWLLGPFQRLPQVYEDCAPGFPGLGVEYWLIATGMLGGTRYSQWRRYEHDLWQKFPNFSLLLVTFFCGGEEFPGHEPPFWHHLKFQLTLSNDDFQKFNWAFLVWPPKRRRLQTFETPTLFGPLEVF